MNTIINNNGLNIEQLEERFEMVVAEGDSRNTTTIEIDTK